MTREFSWVITGCATSRLYITLFDIGLWWWQWNRIVWYLHDWQYLVIVVEWWSQRQSAEAPITAICRRLEHSHIRSSRVSERALSVPWQKRFSKSVTKFHLCVGLYELSRGNTRPRRHYFASFHRNSINTPALSRGRMVGACVNCLTLFTLTDWKVARDRESAPTN